MLPVRLRATAHHDQLAVRQRHFALVAGAFVAQGECAGGAEADRGNHRVGAKAGFVIAVPGHALRAVGIQIEQTGVEAKAWVFRAYGRHALLHPRLDGQQPIRPRQRGARNAGIGVAKGRIAIPSHLARGAYAAASDHHLVVPPGDLGQQVAQVRIGLIGRKHRAVVVEDAVKRQQVVGGVLLGGEQVGHVSGWAGLSSLAS